MRSEDFIALRRDDWNRLEDLLARAGAGHMNALTPAQVLTMAALYRRATADLARAQRDWPGEPVHRYRRSPTHGPGSSPRAMDPHPGGSARPGGRPDHGQQHLRLDGRVLAGCVLRTAGDVGDDLQRHLAGRPLRPDS